MSKKVICFGEVLWDIFPEGEKIGGAPLNVALRLKALGISSVIVSTFPSKSRVHSDSSVEWHVVFVVQTVRVVGRLHSDSRTVRESFSFGHSSVG